MWPDLCIESYVQDLSPLVARTPRRESQLTKRPIFRLPQHNERASMSAGDWKDLYQAVIEGDLPLVQHHIREGVNPNYQHPEILRTPLVASLVEGHLEIAHYLLAHGSDPSLVSELDNLAPLQAARKHGRHEFVSLLSELGAKEPRQPFWWRWLPI